MDPLLARQLRKHLPAVDSNEPQWRAFLAAVESAYADLRQDRTFIEHTLETTSKELTEANEKIRQDAESKLAALSRYYQQTLELQQGMIQCVRLTPRGFEYTLSRGQLLHRLGLTSDQVEGHTVEEVVLASDCAAVLNGGFARAWAGEEVATPYTALNGLELFILMRPRYENGAVCEIIASFVEITALKETERALIAAKERAEAADHAKSEFLAVMSHEIRTPLNAVLGFSDLLLNTPLNAEQKGWVSTVCRSGESLLTLLNGILDFSKIEAGQFELHPEPTVLLPMLQEITAMFQVQAVQKGITFTLEAEPSLPANVTLDQQRLRQVLINLAGNAAKFTHQGSIRFCVSNTPDEANPGHGLFHFSVADTGIGIPADRRDRLFKPFSQVDSSTTRNYGGTGLGLAICDRIVRMLGGEIKVSSKLGQGSTFSFSVPAEFSLACPPPPAASLPVESRRPVSAQALRILVAEDHPRNRDLIGLILESRGYGADLVENGRLALEAALRQPYDLVFMDLQMPEMDGYAASREIIAQLDPVRCPKIYALSANVYVEDRQRCVEAGMEGLLAKPINSKELFAVISAVAAGRPFVPQT